jgi:hypothetical protein
MDIPPKFMRGNQPAVRHCDQPIHYFSAPSIAFTARRSVCRRGLASRPALQGFSGSKTSRADPPITRARRRATIRHVRPGERGDFVVPKTKKPPAGHCWRFSEVFIK